MGRQSEGQRIASAQDKGTDNMLATLDYYLTEDAIKTQLPAPYRAYPSDAGIDLRSLSDIELPPHSTKEVPTGVGFRIPVGWFGLICNRTSWGKDGLLPMGHVVDADYTGEIILIIRNITDAALTIKAHDRIAQMVVMPVFNGELRPIAQSDMPATKRGEGRVGSSGTR